MLLAGFVAIGGVVGSASFTVIGTETGTGTGAEGGEFTVIDEDDFDVCGGAFVRAVAVVAAVGVGLYIEMFVIFRNK